MPLFMLHNKQVNKCNHELGIEYIFVVDCQTVLVTTLTSCITVTIVIYISVILYT